MTKETTDQSKKAMGKAHNKQVKDAMDKVNGKKPSIAEGPQIEDMLPFIEQQATELATLSSDLTATIVLFQHQLKTLESTYDKVQRVTKQLLSFKAIVEQAQRSHGTPPSN